MAGRGRPPKNSFNDEGMDMDNTTIEGKEVKQSSGRGRPKGAANAKKEIVADKLNVLVGLFANMLGYEYNFTAADFQKESIALSNISNDYKIVGKVLEMLDPLVMIGGLFAKFRSMKKKPKKNVSRETNSAEGQNEEKTRTVPNETPKNIFNPFQRSA